MRASALEFRLRMLLHAVVYGLGFWAPWNYVVHLDPTGGANAHVWGILAANLTRAGVEGIGTAFNILLGIAIVCAFLAAALRTWGAAYLGALTVQDGQMLVGDGVIVNGPYRFVRNPLYLGTFLHTLALSLLMPRSGAVFAIVAIALLQVRLVLGEEYFLRSRLQASYAAYCRLVPRFFPTFRAKVKGSGRRARWMQAFLAEIYMWGVAGSFAVAGWQYNANLLIQCVVVAFGGSLVLRAATSERPNNAGERAT